MAKVGVFFAKGFEEIEALTVVDLCRRAGIEAVMVSVDGTPEAEGSHGITVKMDTTLADVDFDALDMLVLPGGMPGTLHLEASSALMEQLDRFYESGRWVAAICAAPQIFGHRGYLKGRRATSFPAMEQELEGAQVTHGPAEADGNVITGRGMGCAIDFGLKIVEKLVSGEAAAELADRIVYER
ncbi:MAG: DJ-1/PfpI family protein [Eubacteriales bacterium]|nr:DJ-1/PfpI family protein [Eubacteriales bacterium]